MKYIFIAFLLAITIVCNGQSNPELELIHRVYKDVEIESLRIDTILNHSHEAKEIIIFKKDTLNIISFDVFKFIKIGERVYRINPPTLTEVQEVPTIRSGILSFPNGTWTYPTGTSGITLIQADSSTRKTLTNK